MGGAVIGSWAGRQIFEGEELGTMASHNQVTHEGKKYYSVFLVSRLLGTTKDNVRKIIAAEHLEWTNINGGLTVYVSVESYDAYCLQKKS